MPRADEQPVSRCQGEQLLGLTGRVDERLLHVDVCPGVEGFARGLEMRACRGAHVHDVRLGDGEQLSERLIARRIRECSKLAAGVLVLVVHTHHQVRRAHPTQGVKMEASHVAGADEGNAEGVHDGLRVQEADPCARERAAHEGVARAQQS